MRSVSKWPARALVTAGAFAIAALWMSSSASAQADAKTASCDFVEIKATTSATDDMDKSLPAKVQAKLKAGPFKARNNFKLWGKQTVKLTLRKAQRLKLAVGEAEVLFRQHSTPEGKTDRVTLGLDIDDDKGSRVLETKVNVDAGDFILVSRSISKDVEHVVAVSCTVN